jgi:hypothetical protein
LIIPAISGFSRRLMLKNRVGINRFWCRGSFEDEDGILIYAPFQVLEPSKRIRKSQTKSSLLDLNEFANTKKLTEAEMADVEK